MKRVLAAVILAVLPAACGGGGTGIGTSSVSHKPPVTAQREVAAQALAVPAFVSAVANTVGGVARARSLRDARRRHTGQLVWSPCQSGFEYAQNQISDTETQSGERIFYDPNCVHLQEDIEMDIVMPNADDLTATGSTTTYDPSGNVTAYMTMKLMQHQPATGAATFTIELTDAPKPGAPQIWALSITCSGDAQAATIPCSYGSIAHETALQQDLGVALSMSVSQGTDPMAISGTGVSSIGALDALTLSQTQVPAWTIGGGSTGASTKITGQFGLNTQPGENGLAPGSTTSAVSSGAGLTANLSVSSSGVSGTVTQTSSGQTLARFTTDVNGNGTITYSNGKTGTISSWMILS